MRTRKGDQAANAATDSKPTASTPRASRSSTAATTKRTSSSSAPVVASPPPPSPSSAAAALAAATAVADAQAQPLPPALRLPVLATMGLAISTVLHVLATQFGDGEVGSVARTAGGWGEVWGVVGWRS